MSPWILRFAPIWVGSLVFVYPIPHTIALRNLLLLLGLILFATGLRMKQFSRPSLRGRAADLLTPAIIFIVLSSWIVIATSAWGFFPSTSLRQFLGDWCIAFLATFLAATASFYVSAQRLIGAAMLALIAHLAWVLAYQIYLLPQAVGYPLGIVPYAQRDYQSGLGVLSVALSLADLMARFRGARPLSRFSTPWVRIHLYIGLVATITIYTRNGTVVVIGLLAAAAAIAVFSLRSQLYRWAVAGIAGALLTVVAATSLFSDERWTGLVEAFTVASDTKTYFAWLDETRYPYPTLADGRAVEQSAYARIAWATVAIEQIHAYPLGVGYGHQAFGRAVARSYNQETGLQSSHSGILDFTLANGIPGGLMWSVLCIALAWIGWKRFRDRGDATGLALALVVASYYARCLVDGHLSGFRLEMNAFLVGLLLLGASSETDHPPCA